MKVGDRILAINGIGAKNLCLDDASMLLRQTDADAVLLVEYDVAVLGMFTSISIKHRRRGDSDFFRMLEKLRFKIISSKIGNFEIFYLFI